MKPHFEQFAAYNRWANARLYQAAFALSEEDYRRNAGAFFKSMHGTLNHLLVADRIWLKRLTGEGDHPNRLDAILFEDRGALALARADEDDRLARYVGSLDDDTLEGVLEYATTSGRPFAQKRREILAHLFNHQTHHRGQAHTILSIVTGREPPSLDLLLWQRDGPAPDLRALGVGATG
jgi:uncharacterized damage-inducible protein DinB